jgi:hypothetical protein
MIHFPLSYLDAECSVAGAGCAVFMREK